MLIEGKQGCDRCGKPAEYVEKGDRGVFVCGVCVHFDAGDKSGERFGAATMFMVAAEAAHHSGLTVSDLHTLVTEAVSGDEWRGVDVPALSSIECPRAERPWLAHVKRLEGRAA